MSTESDFGGLVAQIQNWLGSFPKAESYVLLVRDEAGNSLVRAGQGFDELVPLLKALVAESASKRTAWLATTQGHFQSCLCVPVYEQPELQSGLLVLASQEAKAFVSQDVDRINLLTRGFGERLARCRPAPVQNVPTSRRPHVAVGFLLALAVLFLFALIPRPARRSPVPPKLAEKNVTVRTAGPEQLARTLLQEASRGNSQRFYAQCSQRFRTRWSPDRFEKSFSAWSSTPGNRWELDYREVAVGEQDEKKALLHIRAAERLGKQPIWRWTMLKEDNGWRLDSMDEGPFTLH